DRVHHYRSAAAGDVEQALHAQEIAAAQRNERLHGAREGVPRERRILGENEAQDAIAVLGFGDEARARRSTGRRIALEHKARIEIAVDRAVNGGARIERAKASCELLDRLRLGEVTLRDDQ